PRLHSRRDPGPRPGGDAMTSAALPQFECDMDPDTRFPRIRFNFANGWSASLVVRAQRCDAMLASVAACPTKEWGTGKTELGPTEAFADEAIEWIDAICRRSSAVIVDAGASNPDLDRLIAEADQEVDRAMRELGTAHDRWQACIDRLHRLEAQRHDIRTAAGGLGAGGDAGAPSSPSRSIAAASRPSPMRSPAAAISRSTATARSTTAPA